MRSTWGAGLLLSLILTACAETNAPLPEPEEVLLVVNSTSATLSIIPVEAPTAATQVSLGATSRIPPGASAREDIAIVPLGEDDAVAVVDLRAGNRMSIIPLPPGSGATGSAIVHDSIAYVANPGLNSVSRVNYREGTTTEIDVGMYPRGVVFTRGRIFVLNANLHPIQDTAGPSWITVIDRLNMARSSGIDSIPLTGPGNASFADVGEDDGLLYIVSAGAAGDAGGRLSIVDPVGRTELASFSGFGVRPGPVASDGGERLFVSSTAEGLMAFNTRTRTVERGVGNGIAVPNNSAVAVDSRGRIYALAAGACQGDQPGTAHVLDEKLVVIRTIGLGGCPSDALVVRIPPEGAPEAEPEPEGESE